MYHTREKYEVGEVRPSQLLHSFGIGSVIDLPNLSVMVMGLEDWDTGRAAEIGEERLLSAVQAELGPQVKRLVAPPLPSEDAFMNPLDPGALAGIPVATFPRWMLCPQCRILAPLDSGFFQLKADPFRADRTRYVHTNCNKAIAPAVLPARFLTACEAGHLDEFPWLYFVHEGQTGCNGPLRLYELGVSGEAAEIQIECDGCRASRRMADAFGEEGKRRLPACRGRHPHLRDFDDQPCEQEFKAILLGASNSWFGLALSVLSVPTSVDRLGQLIDAQWHVLEKLQNQQNVELLRQLGQLSAFQGYSDADVWAAIERKRAGAAETDAPRRLKVPEWHVLANPATAPSLPYFRVREVLPPAQYHRQLARVVLVERLREVSSLIGFTRISSPGDLGDVVEVPEELRAPLSRKAPTWVPAGEVHGEGIFIQFREPAIRQWLSRSELTTHDRIFAQAHRQWRHMRRLDASLGYPGLRYVLLHSFAHALMRQLALECGYAVASIRERIYSLPPTDDDGPMAGVLLYTAAPDSEGTLGGLVRLGTSEELERHITGALEAMRLCSSDPLCAEHPPQLDPQVLHGAACHACLFAPETSCEYGNKYLDRTVLVNTVEQSGLAFFDNAE